MLFSLRELRIVKTMNPYINVSLSTNDVYKAKYILTQKLNLNKYNGIRYITFIMNSRMRHQGNITLFTVLTSSLVIREITSNMLITHLHEMCQDMKRSVLHCPVLGVFHLDILFAFELQGEQKIIKCGRCFKYHQYTIGSINLIF